MNVQKLRPAARRIAAAAALLAMTLPAFAARAADTKIGFVDIDQVAQRSSTIQASVKASEDKIKAAQGEIETMAADLRRLQDELKTKRSILSEPEVRKQTQKIDELRDQMDTKDREVNKEIRRAETEVMGPAVDRILATVKRVGAANGFGLVLRSDVVLYGVEGLDITSVVVGELDKEGKAAAPAPAAKPEPKPKK